MGLLVIEGFDVWNDDDVFRDSNWSPEGGAYFLFTSSGARTGRCLIIKDFYPAGYVKMHSPELPPRQTMVAGFAAKFLGVVSANPWEFMAFQRQFNHLAKILVNQDRSISIYTAGATVATSNPGLYTSGEWRFWELKTTPDPTNGYVEVRLDGATVLTYSGPVYNSTYPDFSDIDGLRLSGQELGYLYIDDLYILETSGDKNNDFLGPVVVDTLQVTGQGNYAEWTPSGETFNYQCVDDYAPMGGATKYIKSETVDERDSYAFTDLNIDRAIHGVQFEILGARDSAYRCKVAQFFRDKSGVDHYSGEKFLGLSGDPTVFPFPATTTIWELNPETGEKWTAGDINSGEFGIKFTGAVAE
jgi:hypothetical protein